MRVAIFYTPPANHPLTRAAAAWLTRDAFSGQQTPPPDDPDLSADAIGDLTAEPRRYGFHATLKAPFRLAPGCDLGDVIEAARDFARAVRPPDAGPLRLERLGSFFALTPTRPSSSVNALAAEVVRRFEPFRAPLSADEEARRRQANLTRSQAANLARWGYPYVMDDFRFHMTLTGSVHVDRQSAVAAALQRRFATFIGRPLAIDALSIFVEPQTGADFKVVARLNCDGNALVPVWP